MKEYFQTRLFKVQVGKRVSLVANGETYVKIGPNSLQAGPNGTVTRVPIITPVILEKDQYWHWPPPEPLYGDDGFDPILGPPYPPTNYQMLVHDGRLKNGVQDFLQPRLTWTAPDVIVETEFIASPKQFFIYVKNYFQDPTVAAQSGTTVTVSGGPFVFIDTASNEGEQIRWKHGEIATIVEVISPTQATVTPSQSVASGEFAVLPENILFTLYQFNGATWIVVGTSNNNLPLPRADWLNSEFTGTEVEAFECESILLPGVNYFYVVASVGTIQIFSPTMAFDNPP